MASLFNSLIVVLGAWLGISAFFLGARGVALAVALISAVALIALGVAAMRQKEFKATLDYIVLGVGISLAVWGVVGWAAGLGAGLNEIIVGVLAVLFSFGATRFARTYASASFYDRGGAPMVDVKSLRMKDGDILMKALLLQSMPSTVYVKPDEVWKVLTMIPFDLIKKMPGYLLRGYRECVLQEKKQEVESQR